MKERFAFDHFPREEEIIDDATAAFRLQLSNGAGPEIAEAIIQRMLDSAKKDESEESFNKSLEMDTAGMTMLARLQNPDYHLSHMTEEEREMTSLLWVNYMCDQPYGQIVDSMYRLVMSGIDYKRKGLEIIHRLASEQEIDDAVYSGTIIYLWTMINVVRSVKKSVNGFLEVPPVHLHNGMSLN